MTPRSPIDSGGAARAVEARQTHRNGVSQYRTSTAGVGRYRSCGKELFSAILGTGTLWNGHRRRVIQEADRRDVDAQKSTDWFKRLGMTGITKSRRPPLC